MEKQEQGQKQLLETFTKEVAAFRGFVQDYFADTIEGDFRLLEKKIVSMFKEIPKDLRTEAMLIVLSVVGRPVGGCDDPALRLSHWLQALAFAMFDTMNQINLSE